MDTVYLVSALVGGFFVLLSMFGGGEADVEFEAEVDVDMDAEIGAGPGFIDLFSLRTLFLFMAFFGLCGVLLSLTDVGELVRAAMSVATGAVIGLGGNWVVKRVAFKHISSTVTVTDLKGRSGHVIIPFGRDDRGKIVVTGKGQRRQLVACAFEEAEASFELGDEVVIVRVDGGVAEVVKPS